MKKYFLNVYKKIKKPYKLKYIPINKPSGYDYYSYRNHVITSILKKIKKLYYTSGKYKDLPTKKHLS